MFTIVMTYLFTSALWASFDTCEGELLKTSVLTSVLDASYELQTLIPISNSDNTNKTLMVNVDWNLVNIVTFDETNGYLEASGYLAMSWEADYVAKGGSDKVLIENSKIWKPPVVLLKSLEGSNEIGSSQQIKISYESATATCLWKPWYVTKIGCTPNVKYYPFDKQSCTFKLAVWGYTNEEVTLMPNSSRWTFEFFEENGEWIIDKTSVEASVINEISVINYKIQLSRRPLYYIINLIVPVIILSVLNVCAFLIPADAGERISFSMTCCLSYVVLLNVIMGFMPTSASPMSNLTYYTFIMMIFSAGVSLSTIISLRIHLKSEEDQIPAFILGLLSCLTCKCCKCQPSGNRVQRIVPSSSLAEWDDPVQTGNNFKIAASSQNGKNSKPHLELTWKKVGSYLDIMLFLGFLVGEIFYTVAYLVPLFLNA